MRTIANERWMCCAGVVAAALLAGSAWGGTIYVDGTNGDDAWTGECERHGGGNCGPKKTIQAGVDAAKSGDTVAILKSVYTISNTIKAVDKSLEIIGLDGRDECIIDGNSKFGGVILFQLLSDKVQSLELTVQDLTFRNSRNGLFVETGGIGRTLIESCTFRDIAETGLSLLGYPYSNQLEATVRKSLFEDIEGRALRIDGFLHTTVESCECNSCGQGFAGEPQDKTIRRSFDLRNCAFSDTTHGPAIRSDGCDTSIRDCTFVNCYNESDSEGIFSSDATVCVVNGNGSIKDSIFWDNISTGAAGALRYYGGRSDLLFLENCEVVGNLSEFGAGLAFDHGRVSIYNCLFRDNVALSEGGAIYAGGINDPETTIGDSTFVGNMALGAGGGIFAVGQNVQIANSIVFGNEDFFGTDETSQIRTIGCDLAIEHSCVEGWTGDLGGEGNFGDDPRFINATEGDLRLRSDSPCVDAGLNELVPQDTLDLDNDGDTDEPLPIDLAGQPRIADESVDMGAYEFFRDCNANDIPDDQEGDLAPRVLSGPTDTATCVGSAAAFEVVAEGPGELSYQWRHDGNEIAGATDSVLLIPKVRSDDAGAYDVVVTCPCGEVTSASASLTVNVGSGLAQQPTGADLCVGDAHTLTAVAEGTPPFSYQWRKDGVDMPGATEPEYELSDAQPADAGSYTVVITNECGTVESGAAAMTVAEGAEIIAQSGDTSACIGESASFTISVSGAEPISIQWRKDGANIDGATASVFTIDVVSDSDVGVYDAVAENECGTALSDPVTLAINRGPTITDDPESAAASERQAVTFAVAVDESDSLAYQWRKDAVEILNANAATFTIDPVSASDAGAYDVVVTNACGSATSAAAVLTVRAIGDLNCDASIDFNDIDAFVAALTSKSRYEQDYPGCDYLLADINGDTSVDFDDIDGFVECLINNGCP